MEEPNIDFSTPLLVLGGAGTGKSHLFLNTIERLIFKEKVPPERILALTFSSNTASRLRRKIEERITPGYRELNITTFTSLAARILRENWERGGVPFDFEVLSGFRERVLMRELLSRERNNLRSPLFKKGADLPGFAEEILNLFGFLWSSLAGGRELKNAINSIPRSDLKERLSDILFLLCRFEEELAKVKGLTYRQLVFKAVELLCRDEEVRRHYQEKFHFLLVDEFQDTDRAQLELLFLLAGEHRRIVAFGDPDGIIFRFRGSDPRNIASRFEEKFPGAKRLVLTKNYRLFPKLTELIGRLGFTSPEAVASEGRVAVSIEPTRVDEAFFVARAIKKLTLEGKLWGEGDGERFNYQDVAILLRDLKDDLAPFEEALSYFDIPYQVVGYSDFFLSPEVRFVISYLKALAGDEGEFRKVLASPVYSLDRLFLISLIEEGEGKGYSLFPLMELLLKRLSLDYPEDFPGWGEANIPRFRPKLMAEMADDRVFGFFSRLFPILSQFFSLRKEIDQSSLPLILRKIIRGSGIVRFAREKGREEEALTHLGSLLSLVDEYGFLFSAIHHHPSDFSLFVSQLPELLTVYGEGIIEEEEEEAPKVKIMSIHQAKGREFEVVFIPRLTEGNFPKKGGGRTIFTREELLRLVASIPEFYHPLLASRTEEIADEKRLFLVAVTRAKKRLFLSYPQTVERAPARPSRFLRAVVSEGIEEEAVRRFGMSFFNGISARSLVETGAPEDILSHPDLEGFLKLRKLSSSPRLLLKLEELRKRFPGKYIPDSNYFEEGEVLLGRKRKRELLLEPSEIVFTPRLISDFVVCPRRAFFSSILNLHTPRRAKFNWRRLIREALLIINQPHRRRIYLSEKSKDKALDELFPGLFNESLPLIRSGEKWRFIWGSKEVERAVKAYVSEILPAERDYQVIASGEEISFSFFDFSFRIGLDLLKIHPEKAPILEVFEFGKDKKTKTTVAINKVWDMTQPRRELDLSPLLFYLAAKSRLKEEGIEEEPAILYRFLRGKGEEEYSFPQAIIAPDPLTEWEKEEWTKGGDFHFITPSDWVMAEEALREICERVVRGDFPPEPVEGSSHSCLGYFGCPYEKMCWE